MKTLLPAIFVVLVFPVIFQLLFPGFFVSDDGEWMIIRFSSFYQELTNFQIPVRYLNRLNNGYGYPVATFLYPGFMYLASILKVLGFGFIASVKGVLILSILSAFVGMFFFLKGHFSRISAIVGACLYIYNPYFLWDIYKRGSVGEVLALGIIPFILYFIDSEKRMIVSILTAFLIISHNTLAILFLPFILVYLLITQLSKKVEVKIIASRIVVYVVLSLGISAFFWIPALFELPLTVFRNTVISSFGEYFVAGHFLVGVINLMILIAAVVYILVRRKYSLVLYLMLGTSILSLFLSYEVSSQFWSRDFLGRFVQFPFRFLSLFTVAIAYLGAFLFSRVNRYISIFAALSIGFVFVGVFPFLASIEHKQVEDSYYSTNVDTTTVKNEYMPAWVKNIPTQVTSEKMERIDESTIQINTIYWPGHSVYVSGEKVAVDYMNDEGVMRIKTDAPVENIEVVFEETQLRVVSDIVTVASFVIAFALLFRKTTYA